VCITALLPFAPTACSNDPCPPGQTLHVGRFHDRFQARSRGCVDRDDAGRIRLQGRWEWFYESGRPEAVGAYRNGRADGPTGQTGIPRRGREGPWMFWHANGQKKQQLSYVDGRPEGPGYQWYENGQQQYEAQFRDGRADGAWNSWYANGQKHQEGTYEDGQPVGVWTVWDESGVKVHEGPYRDDLLR